MFQSLTALILITLLLNGCHFHLRGPVTLAKPLQHVYVQASDPYGELMRNLKQYLRMSGAHLADKEEEASSVLDIEGESSKQDLASINSSQQTRQYNLILAVTFSIRDPQGNILLPSQTITEKRTLTLQSNQVLAGSNQAAQLYESMRRSIVYNMMLRLASPSVSKALGS